MHALLLPPSESCVQEYNCNFRTDFFAGMFKCNPKLNYLHACCSNYILRSRKETIQFNSTSGERLANEITLNSTTSISEGPKINQLKQKSSAN